MTIFQKNFLLNIALTIFSLTIFQMNLIEGMDSKNKNEKFKEKSLKEKVCFFIVNSSPYILLTNEK